LTIKRKYDEEGGRNRKKEINLYINLSTGQPEMTILSRHHHASFNISFFHNRNTHGIVMQNVTPITNINPRSDSCIGR